MPQALTRILSATVLTVLVMACGTPRAVPEGESQQSRAGAAAASIEILVKRDVAPAGEGTLEVLSVKTATAQGLREPIQLGTFVTGTIVGRRAEATYVQALDSMGAVTMFAVGPDRATVLSHSINVAEVPAVAVSADGGWYTAHGKRVVQFSPAGAPVTEFAVPVPPVATPMIGGQPAPGRFNPQAARVGALVVTGSGPLALIDNATTVIVADLERGRTSVVGKGDGMAMAVGPDGSAYALLLDPSDRSNSYLIVRLDLADLSVLGHVDTGIRPGDGPIDARVQLGIDSIGRVWVYASQELVEGAPHESHLLRTDGDMIEMQTIELLPNSGALMTVAADDHIYLYGGPARNVITRVDPETGIVSLSPFVGPADSFVLALFTR
ncbi:MAG: hypothetical protein ACRDGE_06130 [Candidatus Limnocylindria bacterium]